MPARPRTPDLPDFGSPPLTEVALSLVLLVSAGLLVRTFGQLQKVDPGFNPDRILTLTVTLPEYRYKEGDAQRRFVGLPLVGTRRKLTHKISLPATDRRALATTCVPKKPPVSATEIHACALISAGRVSQCRLSVE